MAGGVANTQQWGAKLTASQPAMRGEANSQQCEGEANSQPAMKGNLSDAGENQTKSKVGNAVGDGWGMGLGAGSGEDAAVCA